MKLIGSIASRSFFLRAGMAVLLLLSIPCATTLSESSVPSFSAVSLLSESLGSVGAIGANANGEILAEARDRYGVGHLRKYSATNGIVWDIPNYSANGGTQLLKSGDVISLRYTANAYGQVIAWEVTKYSGSDGRELVRSKIAEAVSGDPIALNPQVAQDAQGNFVVVGGYLGTVQIGGQLQPKASKGASFVAKFSSTWTLLFVKPYLTSSTVSYAFNGVAVDPQNNLYVVGDFLGKSSLLNLSSSSSKTRDDLAVKFSSAGELVWARSFPRLTAIYDPQIDPVNGFLYTFTHNCFDLYVTYGFLTGNKGSGTLSSDCKMEAPLVSPLNLVDTTMHYYNGVQSYFLKAYRLSDKALIKSSEIQGTEVGRVFYSGNDSYVVTITPKAGNHDFLGLPVTGECDTSRDPIIVCNGSIARIR